jgi:phospholipid/cholesterol/gamma-HCH transport system ATP-binding protein
MNSVMGIGEKIMFLYKGQKSWEGNKKDITHSGVKEFDDFVFANKVMNNLRKAEKL